MKIAIIGAGLSGITSAYIIKKFDSSIKIDLFEKQKIIGGNCLDEFDKAGYIQKFGPHIFHTNKKYIWNYLNSFSKFNPYQHKVLSYIEGEHKQFPFTKEYIKNYDVSIFDRIKENRDDFTNAEDYLYYILGKELTDLYFKNYSEKQWGITFNQLSVDVVKRIPIRENNDIRYFSDKYQGIPNNGYTCLLQDILKKIKVKIIWDNINYEYIKTKYDLIINTGESDSFFNNIYGELEYRSVLFEFMIKLNPQKVAVINYPNDYDFTRITEYNHFLTSNYFGLEYPVKQNTKNSIKCYPIFWEQKNKEKFIKYQQLAKQNNVILLGRMGLYQYLNMDAAIDLVFNTLTQFNSLELKQDLENDIII